MNDYVALLRGVNVGGITVRSADLRALFVELGFADARTFLASGNVRFTAPDTDRTALKQRIEDALGERFGYTAWIVLRTRDEVRAALDAFPFDAADDRRQPYLVFCSDPASKAELERVAADVDTTTDPVAGGQDVLYWHPPRGASTDTPFAKELARARWKAVTTTRNVRTIAKIVA